MKRTFLLLGLFFCFFSAQANERDSIYIDNEPKVELISKYYDDAIVLRWAPVDAKFWYFGIHDGFEISRRVASEEGSKYEVIEANYKPWSEDKMIEWYTANPSDEEIIIPLQTIHRDWENTMYEDDDILSVIEKSEYFEQRHQMTILAADLHPLVADAAGLRYVDRSIEPDKVYAYRVRYNTEKHRQAFTVVKNRTIVNKPILFEAIEKEQAIQLRWEKRLHERHFTAYHIERSLDGQNYDRINDQPYVQALSQDFKERKFMIFTDSVENYQPYHYRLIGVDAFGDMSEPSESVLVKGRDRTPPVVGTLNAEKINEEKRVQLSWEHSDPNELGKVIVYKNDRKQKAQLVCEQEADFTFSCIDENPIEGTNDYHLVLVDTVGNYAQSQRASVYFKDKTPPSPPTGLKAEVDTNGVVILSWDQGPEDDLLAYYIFTADHKGKNFIKLNPRKHIFRLYTDSLNTDVLTQKRYYKVAAMDKGGNIGDYSEVLEVNRPDKIPPAPALFYNYKVDEKGVFLGLLPSSSRDVVEHTLFRREQGNTEWKAIKTYQGRKLDPLYYDQDLISNKTYTYKLIAKDNAGLLSSEDPSMLTVTAYDFRVQFVPELSIRKTEEGTELAIANTIPGENYRIELIRSIQGGKYTTLSTLKDKKVYLDKHTKEISDKIKPVKYKARILYKDGKRSKYSMEISLEK